MNELIENHIGYAHAIAAELAGKYPPNITRADLERAAEFGLVQAAQSYDPSRSVSFATFAYYRVRGAIFDEVRKSWHASHVKVALDTMAMAESTEAQTAEAKYQSSDEVNEYSSVTSGQFLSLESAHSERIPAATESPASDFLRKEESEVIHEAIRQLPQRHRLVLQAYYFEDLSLVNIGRQLNLSKSWVSRIHAQALAKLRRLLPESIGPRNIRTSRRAAMPTQATLCPEYR
jgi:RNA polymerase sigma factor for flagellar operon FliA